MSILAGTQKGLHNIFVNVDNERGVSAGQTGLDEKLCTHPYEHFTVQVK